MISVHQAEIQSTVLMVANGTTNGMPSWTANTPGNVFLVSTFDNFHALVVNADLPGVAEEIKTHNMSEFVAGINVNNGDVAEKVHQSVQLLVFVC